MAYIFWMAHFIRGLQFKFSIWNLRNIGLRRLQLWTISSLIGEVIFLRADRQSKREDHVQCRWNMSYVPFQGKRTDIFHHCISPSLPLFSLLLASLLRYGFSNTDFSKWALL